MSFIDFALAHGVVVKQLFTSNKIMRTGTTDKPRSNNGSYYWDGSRGWVLNWQTGGKVEWYNDPQAKPWSPQEKTQWAIKNKQATNERNLKALEASKKADLMLKSATKEEHNYLHLKGFPDEMGLVLESRLLIPMRDVRTNTLRGLQHIYFDLDERKYIKKMLTGMRASYAVHWIGNKNSIDNLKILVEGYATALSVYSAVKTIGMNASVVCCFSASNLVNVASVLEGRVGIYADNDLSKTGENSAIQTGLPYVMSDVVGNDANDDMREFGILSVAKKIMELNKACK